MLLKNFALLTGFLILTAASTGKAQKNELNIQDGLCRNSLPAPCAIEEGYVNDDQVAKKWHRFYRIEVFAISTQTGVLVRSSYDHQSYNDYNSAFQVLKRAQSLGVCK